MFSKELHNLEANGMVKRSVQAAIFRDDFPRLICPKCKKDSLGFLIRL